MAQRRADMFTGTAADPRPEPPTRGDERSTLIGFLAWQRQTLRLKCADLTPDQLATRSAEPSTMSLLGLVRHLAEVERSWFQVTMAGHDAPAYFITPDSRDGDFDDVRPTPETVAEALATWDAAVAFADRYIADAESLDVVGAVPDAWRGPMSLRWVLVHMIEEYARHNGHADLLRERIDGRIGQ